MGQGGGPGGRDDWLPLVDGSECERERYFRPCDERNKPPRTDRIPRKGPVDRPVVQVQAAGEQLQRRLPNV